VYIRIFSLASLSVHIFLPMRSRLFAITAWAASMMFEVER
jgi:hypothetical protein